VSNTIFIVDASSAQRRSLAAALAGTDTRMSLHASAEDFLLHVPKGAQGCVVAASDLAGMGIRALIQVLRERGPSLPVVVLGRDDALPRVVELMRAGAAEYLEAPQTDRRLRKAVLRVVTPAQRL
jgi:two-component system, LuxR family, response regulator FixJ